MLLFRAVQVTPLSTLPQRVSPLVAVLFSTLVNEAVMVCLLVPVLKSSGVPVSDEMVMLARLMLLSGGVVSST